eukprot:5175503-Ditylum_brightwellii.AAC.1
MATWRSMVNTGKTMTPNDLWDKSNDEGTVRTPSNKRQCQGKKKQRHLTKQASAGLPDNTVKVKVMNDNEDYTAEIPVPRIQQYHATSA